LAIIHAICIGGIAEKILLHFFSIVRISLADLGGKSKNENFNWDKINRKTFFRLF
jgi:hypothetical protein